MEGFTDFLTGFLSCTAFCIISFLLYRLVLASQGIVPKLKSRKRKSSNNKRKTKREILSFVERTPSKSAETISRESGYALSTVSKHLKLLNKAKKVVILKNGNRFMFVLPSDGQNVFKHKIK